MAPLMADENTLRPTFDRARNGLQLEVPTLCDRWRQLDTPGARRFLDLERRGVLEQESDGEREAFRLLFAGRWPVPDCQVVVLGALRADFVFISAGVIVEYFGKATHKDRFVADLTRLHALQAAGFIVIVVVAGMLREATQLSNYIYRQVQVREDLIARGAIPRPVLPLQPRRMRPLTTPVGDRSSVDHRPPGGPASPSARTNSSHIEHDPRWRK